MNDKQRRLYERGQRVRLFMSAHESDFPSGSKGFTLAGNIEGPLAEAAALDVARAASARKRKQGTERRDEARKALRRMVQTTSDTAEAIALDHPEVKGVFNPQIKKNNDQALIAAARSAADAAAPFAALFTESGLAPAFFDEMRSKADDLEIHASSQAEAVGEGVNKTAALADAFRRMDDLVERLDPIVTNRYAADPARLAAWGSASRVERTPRSKPDADTDNTPPPPPADT